LLKAGKAATGAARPARENHQPGTINGMDDPRGYAGRMDLVIGKRLERSDH
jgi:hypothetical protein